MSAKYRGVEQLEARRAHNPEVVGSSPASATIEIPGIRYEYRVFSNFMDFFKMLQVLFWVTFGSLGSKSVFLGHSDQITDQ